MASITSSNAVLMISVPNLFTVPQKIFGFTADNIYDVDILEVSETTMGVDGRLSAGYVFRPVKQKIHLQADSPSNTFFESIWKNTKAIGDNYWLTALITLTSVNRIYSMNNGVLTQYPIVPNARQVLEGRVYEITWESVYPSPYNQ